MFKFIKGMFCTFELLTIEFKPLDGVYSVSIISLETLKSLV